MSDWAADLEFAWAIGLYEGEGSCSCTPHRNGKGRLNLRPRMGLWMTDEDTVRRFAAAVGVGNVYGPRTRTDRSSLPQWGWSVQRMYDVEALLLRMLPHLGERRKAQAQRVLDGIAEIRAGRGRIQVAA